MLLLEAAPTGLKTGSFQKIRRNPGKTPGAGSPRPSGWNSGDSKENSFMIDEKGEPDYFYLARLVSSQPSGGTAIVVRGAVGTP